MGTLPTELRKQLEKACVAAREAGETGARSALQSLAVHHHEPHGSMTAEQRVLRNRLRAHGRQLGDRRDPKRGTQAIDRLVHECAYEQWHRMLFARFLAENHLLVEPKSGVAITMEECEELARDAGEDPWALASRFAERMLPQIFRPDDPVLAVGLPPETRQDLERLLAGLPATVFTADDSLGWTYQFWQSAEKDRVNASGEKITGATLPAVTQLFTEHYMVLFLLHNTIGAWHAGKVLAQRPELAESAESEQTLREAVGLNDYQFDYLRFVREPREGDEECKPTGPWRPAAGTFDGWPKRAAELTVLDPCCGSGHFLVEVLLLLVRLRILEEGLSLEDAIGAVLKDNVFGLELDARCTQIAAFNLALAAWRMIGQVIELPALNVACSGLGPQSTREQWLKLAEQSPEAWKRLPAHAREPVRNGLSNLHQLFLQAPELGSLIDPAQLPADLIAADYETLVPFLDDVFKAELPDEESRERVVAAKGMAAASEILVGPCQGYTLVITNVPYLGRGAQSEVLRAYAEKAHDDAKTDLSTIFLSRIIGWLGSQGTAAVVVPQSWLFLTRYKRLRQRLLRHNTWNVVARLGPCAFETISGHVVNVALVALSGAAPSDCQRVLGMNAEEAPTAAAKASYIRESPKTYVARQADQLKRTDAIIAFEANTGEKTLGDIADTWQGLVTCDDNKFQRFYWEVDARNGDWRRTQQPPQTTAPHTGKSTLVLWEDGRGDLHLRSRAHNFPPEYALSRDGVAVQRMSGLNVTLMSGEVFGDHVAPLLPKNSAHLPAIWAFACSGELAAQVRLLDKQVKIAVGSLLKVPFDLPRWLEVAKRTLPSGLPEPESDDPTQWLFHGHPVRAEAHTALQVGVARLVGYRWPAELDEEMRVTPEARAMVERCAGLTECADDDGIVCLRPVRSESPAANRLRTLLSAAFDDAWSGPKERELLQAAADEFNKGKVARSLEDWLLDRFFEEHCKFFNHRPFVWHIWDGRADGFNALVNYHRLAGPNGEGRRTLESLAYTYLGDWIERQRADQREGKEGADARLAAALDLQEQLKKILAGEPPYDIFVRWKALHEQPIGWDPDINDGVRLNIRPFMSAELRKGGKKGAGILRAKPNINWKKDRGKEPEGLRPKTDFPWFWSCDPDKHPDHRRDFMGGAKFDGNRWNDLHYSNEVKRKAREAHG